MGNIVSKKLCWFMIFIPLFMWSGITEYKAFAQETSKPSTEELKQLADKLERLFNALEEAVQELPRDTFDPEAIIEKIGNNSIKLFEWVRDNTYLVPYRGSLRGPIGVLMDRLGNSLDRALLLHELIDLAGHEVRLARGTLSAEKAKNLRSRLAQIPSITPPSSPSLSREAFDDLIDKYALKHQLDSAEFGKAMKDVEEQEEMVKKLSKRVEEQTRAILNAVGKPKTDKESLIQEAEHAALQDHWWVQWNKENTWVNLDPTFPNAVPNEVMIEQEEYYSPEDLDEELLHLVDIRIIVERWENGQLEEDTALEHTVQPSKLFGKQITLQHNPMNWPEDLNILEEKDPKQSFVTAVLDQKEWLPILSVGSERVTKSSFMDTGEINDTPGRKSGRSGVTGITGGILGAMAGKEKKKKDSQLTAEWIEYEIRVPGEPSQKIRRQIFDAIGPAIRERKDIPKPEISRELRIKNGLALLGENEITIQICHLTSDFVTHWTAKNILANKKILLELLSRGNLTKQKNLTKQISVITKLPGPACFLALARREWSSLGNMVYFKRPNVLNYYNFLRQKPCGELEVCSGFDIVSNEIATASTSDIDPFLIRLKQGVLDTNAEAFLIKGQSEAITNTAEIYSQEKMQGSGWLTIRNLNDPTLKKLDLPEDAKTKIKKDLVAGYVVLVTQKAVVVKNETVVAWWRVNPETGHVLGITESGGGQAQVEYPITKLLISMGAFSNCMANAIISEQVFADKKDEVRMTLKMTLCIVQFAGFGITTILEKETAVGLTLWILKQIIDSLKAWLDDFPIDR